MRIYVPDLIALSTSSDAHLVKVHEMIGIVVEDQEVVLAGYIVDLLASFQRYYNAGGIRARGVYVHYLGRLFAGELATPQRLPQHFRDGAVVILRDRYDFRFVWRYLRSRSTTIIVRWL